MRTNDRRGIIDYDLEHLVGDFLALQTIAMFGAVLLGCMLGLLTAKALDAMKALDILLET